MPAPDRIPTPEPDVARAVSGDRAAIGRLLARHGPLVWSLCRRLTPDPEDAYQEVWEKVFKGLSDLDPRDPTPLASWIATVTHRHLVDRHRRRAVRGDVLPMPEIPVPPDVDDRLDERRRAERLDEAVQRLPVDQRRVVVLHHVEGVALEDIAATEGVAIGTVKSRLHRARARLIELLGGS